MKEKIKKDVTIYDIAEKLGITHPTVSRALNDHPRISSKTKEKVLKVAEELGYRPNYAARSFGTGKTRTIGMIVPDLTNPYFVDYLRAAEKQVASENYSMVTLEYGLAPEQEKKCLEQMLEKRCDAVIANISQLGPLKDILKEFWERKIPIFWPGLPNNFDDNGITMDGIHVDLENGVNDAVLHLTELGHKNIVFVAVWAQQYDDYGRFSGLTKGFEKAGLKLDFNKNVFSLFTGDQLKDGYTAAKNILKERPETTAIIGTNDLVCAGIYKALFEEKVNIPEDMSLIGCDNTWVSKYMPISLTTIDQKTAEVARISVDTIFQRLQTEKWGSAKHINIEPELIIRESTAEPNL